MWKRLLFSVLFLGSAVWVTADWLFGLTEPPAVSVTVPDFRGQTAQTAQACEWLDVVMKYQYDDAVPAGTVIAQTPAAGSERKLNDRRPRCPLTLTVSLGAQTAEIPDVTGEDYRTAVTELRNAGFVVTERTEERGTAGTVQRTEPVGGTVCRSGAEVVLYVGIGRRDEAVTVPALTGLTREEALLQAFLNGLSVNEVREEYADAPEGTVVRQSPAAGSLVRAGTRISLVVSRQKKTE